jgi:hypothetical protein
VTTFEDLTLWIHELFDDCPTGIDRSWLTLYVAHKLCASDPAVALLLKKFIETKISNNNEEARSCNIFLPENRQQSTAAFRLDNFTN